MSHTCHTCDKQPYISLNVSLNLFVFSIDMTVDTPSILACTCTIWWLSSNYAAMKC